MSFANRKGTIMVKKNFVLSNGGGKKFVVTSVTAAALALPFVYASPSVAIARATATPHSISAQRKSAVKKPDMSNITAAQKAFDAAHANFLNEKKAYDKVIADNPVKDGHEFEAQQQTQLDALNAELNSLIKNIDDINANITKTNTSNQEKLQKMLKEFDTLKDQVEVANQKVEAAQNNLYNKKPEYTKKHIEALKKADQAAEVLKAKEAEFNTYKETYVEETPKYEAAKKSYDEKISAIKTQISALEAQITKLPKNTDAGYKEVADQAVAIQKQIDALKDERTSLEAEFKTADASYKEIANKYNALELAYKNAQASVDAANTEIDKLNEQIAADNAKLDSEYKAAKAAYDKAVEVRNTFEATVAEQKKLAAAENDKNNKLYADAEAKFNAYNEKVAEFNKQRDALGTELQTAKSNIDDAYKKLKGSFDTAKQAQDALSDAYTAYNKDVDAYNASLEADYKLKEDQYKKDLAAHEAELAKMKENIGKEGHLTEVVIQTLQWGSPTQTEAEKYIKDGSISWSNPNNVKPGTYFNFTHEPIKGNKNGWIGNLLKPNTSATVTYKQGALNGLVVAGETVKELKITYTNESQFDQYILASVNPQYGFWVRYPDPKNPKKLLGAPASADKMKKIFQSTNIKMQFIGQDGKPIEFSEDKPVNLYLSSLNRGVDKDGTPNHVENVSYNNFDKFIPIKGSWVRTDIKLPLHDGPVIATHKATPSPKEWDNISSEKFYIGAICAQKTSGDTISFTASVYGNPVGGLNPWTAFFDNSKVLPLPPEPVPPTKPDFVQIEKFNPLDLMDPKPTTVNPYTPKHLDPHTPMPNLLKVDDPNLEIGPAPEAPLPPKRLNKLDKAADLPKPHKLGLEAPEAPQALPVVPEIPKTRRLPKTADSTTAALGGLLGMLGSMAVAVSTKLKKK